MKDKVIAVERAVEMIPDGAVLMIGGFLGDGTPENIVDALVKSGKKDLTIIANDTATPERGIGKLIVNKMVKKAIVSHIGTNPETQKQMIEGTLDVELVPQGTLAERVRAGGYGLGGVLTPVGIGTLAENNKQKVKINGEDYLVETALRADFALLKAKKADFYGNLTFTLTSRNFNPLMAFAGKVTIVEVQELVPVGGLTPDEVHVPHAVVDYIVRGE
ncbi:MAG TPA: 3-oxoacid CoA-transferase subunit A [Thermosynergistes sp.]|nr:3-oxoacid CoA-transferase subunit A [Thermosynergistes sp.]HQE21662.1 3-oxoacid CoA-transferase subunit A [Thermosynergistes sp.]